MTPKYTEAEVQESIDSLLEQGLIVVAGYNENGEAINVTKSVYTGFDCGRFVPYTVDFQKKVAKIVEDSLKNNKEGKV